MAGMKIFSLLLWLLARTTIFFAADRQAQVGAERPAGAGQLFARLRSASSALMLPQTVIFSAGIFSCRKRFL